MSGQREKDNTNRQEQKKAFAVAKAEPTFCGTLLKKLTKSSNTLQQNI